MLSAINVLNFNMIQLVHVDKQSFDSFTRYDRVNYSIIALVCLGLFL